MICLNVVHGSSVGCGLQIFFESISFRTTRPVRLAAFSSARSYLSAQPLCIGNAHSSELTKLFVKVRIRSAFLTT